MDGENRPGSLQSTTVMARQGGNSLRREQLIA